MKRTLLAGIVALASALPQVSLAQQPGWYVGATIGQAKAKDVCEGVAGPGLSCEDTDTAWRVLGGFQFNRYLAAELGYHDLGTSKASGPGGTVNADFNAWELVAVASWPFTSQFSVYGKAGMYRGETTGSANTLTLTGSTAETNTDLTYGAGVRFDLSRNLAFRGEWQRYPNLGDNATIGETDVDVLSLGVLWRF